MSSNQKWVSLGKIQREWGLKGQVKCHCFNPSSELFAQVSHLYIQQGSTYELKEIESAKVHGKHWLLHFKGIKDPETARQYRGLFLALPRKELPDLEGGEFYLVDLEGFEVFSPQEKYLGKVQGFQQVGSTEVMVVGESFKEGVWVPYLSDFIQSTHQEEQKIKLTPLAMDLFEISG